MNFKLKLPFIARKVHVKLQKHTLIRKSYIERKHQNSVFAGIRRRGSHLEIFKNLMIIELSLPFIPRKVHVKLQNHTPIRKAYIERKPNPDAGRRTPDAGRRPPPAARRRLQRQYPLAENRLRGKNVFNVINIYL